MSQPVALRALVRQLLGQPAGRFSLHRLHADLRSQGFAIAKDTLHALIDHLEAAFLNRESINNRCGVPSISPSGRLL